MNNMADNHGDKHILIVDDNAIVLRNIKGILGSRYSVAVAPSGLHAMMALKNQKPDLILLDYEMPNMNGQEVMEKIQAREEYKDIPIVFLTSADAKDVVVKLLQLRPAGYILKPVEANLLLDKVQEIIGK